MSPEGESVHKELNLDLLLIRQACSGHYTMDRSG